jgi:hypothetical protein
LKNAPGKILEGFVDLLNNPIATVEGIIEGLSNLPEVPGLIFEYLETIEGNEEAKGQEIAEFITEQLATILSPNKVKVLAQLSKSKLGAAALKVSESLKSFIKKKKLPTTGKIRFIPREIDVKNGVVLFKDEGYVDKFGNTWKKDTSKSYLEWDVQLSETGKAHFSRFSRSGKHINVSPTGEITH